MKGNDRAKNRPSDLQFGLPHIVDLEISGRVYHPAEGLETREPLSDNQREKIPHSDVISAVVVQTGLDGTIYIAGTFNLNVDSDIWPKLSNVRQESEVPSSPGVTIPASKIWSLFVRLVSGISKAGSASPSHSDYASTDGNEAENDS